MAFVQGLWVVPPRGGGYTQVERRALRVDLIRFLLSVAPGLIKEGSKNPFDAMAAGLRRALADYKELGPDGLVDGRPTRSGNRKMILCPDCWQKALAAATKGRCNISMAWRELKKNGALCPENASNGTNWTFEKISPTFRERPQRSNAACPGRPGVG